MVNQTVHSNPLCRNEFEQPVLECVSPSTIRLDARSLRSLDFERGKGGRGVASDTELAQQITGRVIYMRVSP